MSSPLLALAEVIFPGGAMSDADGNLIESLLRPDKNISNLSIHSDKMIFFIWGNEKIDYTSLDKIKGALQRRKGADFVISAVEYNRSGQKYSYASSNQTPLK